MKGLSICIVVVFMLFFPFLGHAQHTMEEAIDSLPLQIIEPVNEYDYKFKPNQLIVPGALLWTGLAGVWGLSEFKNYIRDNMSGYKYDRKLEIDDYFQYSTAAFYVGLGFIPGVKHRNEWKERLMAGVTAYAVMATLTNVLKYTIKEPRPGTLRRNSFPSGHTATAFTGAELMRIEYGNLIGLVGYTVAAGVAALRIYNDRHWINDVLAGAAIGILSARIGYWLLPWERKLFKIKRDNTSAIVVPLIGHTNGISASFTF